MKLGTGIVIAAVIAAGCAYWYPWLNDCREQRGVAEVKLALSATRPEKPDRPDQMLYPLREIDQYENTHRALDLAGCPGGPRVFFDHTKEPQE